MKLSRRHQPVMVVALIFSLLAVIGLGGGAALIWQAKEQKRLAYEAEVEQRQRAEANLAAGMDALDRVYLRFAEWRLPERPLADADREFLQAAVTLFETFARQNKDAPAGARSMAKAYERIAVIRQHLGDFESAKRAFGESILRLEKLSGDDNAAVEDHHELAVALMNRGHLMAKLGRNDVAEQDYRAALARQQDVIAQAPRDTKFRLALANTKNNLANLLRATGRRDDALRFYHECLDLRRSLADAGDTSVEVRDALAESLTNLGTILVESGQVESALPLAKEAVIRWNELVDSKPSEPTYRWQLAAAQSNLASVYRAQGMADESLAARRNAVAAQERLTAHYPGVPEYRNLLVTLHCNLANQLRELKQIPEAIQICQKAIDNQEQLVAEFPKVGDYRGQLADTYYLLAGLLRLTGDSAGEELRLQAAQSLLATLVSENPESASNHNGLARVLAGLAAMAGERGDFDQSRRWASDAVARQRTALTLDPGVPEYQRNLLSRYITLTETLVRADDHEEAARMAEELSRIMPEAWE